MLNPCGVSFSAMRPEVLQRSNWHGQPKSLGDTFIPHKNKGGQQIEAACRLVTHPLSWEPRLEVAGSLQRSSRPTVSPGERKVW